MKKYNLPIIVRSNPLLYVHDGVRCRVLNISNISRGRPKFTCLTTGRGRSVVRLTRSHRMTFKRQLLNQTVYGVKPSQW